jgi:hypothetical protein
MHASAGEKRLSWIAGVLTVERLIQESAEVDARVGLHRPSNPACDGIPL